MLHRLKLAVPSDDRASDWAEVEWVAGGIGIGMPLEVLFELRPGGATLGRKAPMTSTASSPVWSSPLR